MNVPRLIKAAQTALEYLNEYRDELFDGCTVHDEDGNLLEGPDDVSTPHIEELDAVIDELKTALEGAGS